MTGSHDSDFSHQDLHLPGINKDEADVQSLDQLMETSWLNPFCPDQEELVSLSTAIAAPPEIAKDLLEAHRIGEETYEAFKQERMQAATPTTQFYDRLPKKKLKTFSDVKKKLCSKSSAKDVVLKADRKLFSHMILVAESRKLQMSDVLAHPMGTCKC